jgi:ABC-type multidrug transport system permease subunit
MRKILQIALLDLRRTVRDKASFIWMLLLPLALMWLFGNVGFGGSGTPKVTLSLVDHDGGWLARAFVAELEDEAVHLQEFTPEEAPTAENKTRTLVIPQGFTDGVLAGETQIVRLEKEPETSADFALAAEVHIVRTIVRTLGRLIEMNQEGELPGGSAEVDEPAARFTELGEREPLVGLEVETAGEGRPVPAGQAQSVPGMLTMSVLMMTIIYGGVFLTLEKQGGTLRRQMTLPVGRAHVIAGKLGGRLLIALLQAVVLLVAARFLFGLSLGRSFLGLVLLVVTLCIATAGLATLLGAVLRSPEQAGSLGWLAGMILAALGGCWWPMEIVPDWVRRVAHTLPSAWAMDGFHALISFGRGIEGVLLPSAMLLGFGLLFSVLAARFLRVAGGGV